MIKIEAEVIKIFNYSIFAW